MNFVGASDVVTCFDVWCHALPRFLTWLFGSCLFSSYLGYLENSELDYFSTKNVQ